MMAIESLACALVISGVPFPFDERSHFAERGVFDERCHFAERSSFGGISEAERCAGAQRLCIGLEVSKIEDVCFLNPVNYIRQKSSSPLKSVMGWRSP